MFSRVSGSPFWHPADHLKDDGRALRTCQSDHKIASEALKDLWVRADQRATRGEPGRVPRARKDVRERPGRRYIVATQLELAAGAPDIPPQGGLSCGDRWLSGLAPKTQGWEGDRRCAWL